MHALPPATKRGVFSGGGGGGTTRTMVGVLCAIACVSVVALFRLASSLSAPQPPSIVPGMVGDDSQQPPSRSQAQADAADALKPHRSADPVEERRPLTVRELRERNAAELARRRRRGQETEASVDADKAPVSAARHHQQQQQHHHHTQHPEGGHRHKNNNVLQLRVVGGADSSAGHGGSADADGEARSSAHERQARHLQRVAMRYAAAILLAQRAAAAPKSADGATRHGALNVSDLSPADQQRAQHIAAAAVRQAMANPNPAGAFRDAMRIVDDILGEPLHKSHREHARHHGDGDAAEGAAARGGIAGTPAPSPLAAGAVGLHPAVAVVNAADDNSTGGGAAFGGDEHAKSRAAVHAMRRLHRGLRQDRLDAARLREQLVKRDKAGVGVHAAHNESAADSQQRGHHHRQPRALVDAHRHRAAPHQRAAHVANSTGLRSPPAEAVAERNNSGSRFSADNRTKVHHRHHRHSSNYSRHNASADAIPTTRDSGSGGAAAANGTGHHQHQHRHHGNARRAPLEQAPSSSPPSPPSLQPSAA
jgi:hypothetical protein